MLKKLDQYILKSNLILFVSGNLGILCLFIFIDLFERFFDESKFAIFDSFSSILLYYIYDSSSLLETFTPFCFCLCSIITLSKLNQSSQMIAIHSSGISIFRVFKNFSLCGLFLSGLLFASQNYFTPIFSLKKTLIADKQFLIKPIENIHFKDRIKFLNSIPDIKHLKNNHYASIDVEGLILSKSTANKFHATIFDKSGVPIAKLFANKISWDLKNRITLGRGFFFSYFGSNEHQNFKGLQISMNTTFYNAYLAKNNPSCLSLYDLDKFTENKEVFSHYWFRYFFAFQPLFMLLFAFAFVIPLLYKNPVYAYFLTLSSCIFVFLLYKYLKNEMQSNDLSPVMAAIILVSFCTLPLFFNKKSLPT